MKKSTVTNFLIIIGLLVLCVMTLIAVYATVPESSVLLLDESFTHLDETKWTHEVSECREDGDEYQYHRAEGENGFAADGVLRVRRSSGSAPKFRRGDLSKCNGCVNCSSSLFSASLQTKNIFYARSGRIEIGAKFRKGDWMRFRIGVISNDSEPEDESKSFPQKEDFAQIKVVFESSFNRTILESAIADDEFHIYEIDWSPGEITLSVDHIKVDERTFGPPDQTDDRPNATAELNDVLITRPFYISVGVEVRQEVSEKSGDTRGKERSSNETRSEEEGDFEEASAFEIDYIKLFRTGN